MKNKLFCAKLPQPRARPKRVVTMGLRFSGSTIKSLPGGRAPNNLRAVSTSKSNAKRAKSREEALCSRVTKNALFVPFLKEKAGVQFYGRILELGAGMAWFSAELSKLPKVVEVVATDFSSRATEQAAETFKLLRAHEAKITHRRVNSHRLDFPENHFDFVVCAGVLHDALNLLHLLREIRRVLKPGGRLIAVREPVRPVMQFRGRGAADAKALKTPLYSRADYEHAFDRAGFAFETKRVSLATGFKYYFDNVVNGLTHARYAFIATKRQKS
jgi:ubiquinone/menaquinone biosynthesis C-methylase UbiE